MKKKLCLSIMLFLSFLMNAQPNPKFACAEESAFRKLFMFGNKDFYCNLSIPDVRSLPYGTMLGDGPRSPKSSLWHYARRRSHRPRRC
jgi:hypothetical protein